MKRHISIAGQRGFSIVELMIALTIGAIILAAVSMVFISSKQGYTTQDRLARLQENARFAMHFLVKDLRNAGYYGCASDIGAVNNTLNGSASLAYNASNPIEGFDNATNTWYPSGGTTVPTGKITGTDMVIVRMADPGLAINLSSDMPNSSAELTVASTAGFVDGEIIMLSDCESAEIMQITGVQSSAGKLQHAPGGADLTENPPQPGNATQVLSKQYNASNAKVMKFYSRQYYIGTGTSGNPALFRSNNSGTGEELVDGIESLQVLYGKTTDSDRTPNIYLKAGAAGLTTATDWSSVVSVRIGILARTLTQEDTDTDSASYDVDDDGTNDYTAPGDRHKRRLFSATVFLRNL